MHSNGISFEGDVLDLAVEHKIVAKSGSWFRYGDTQLGQGKEKARAFLVETPEVTEEIKQKVLQAFGHKLGNSAEDTDGDDDAVESDE